MLSGVGVGRGVLRNNMTASIKWIRDHPIYTLIGITIVAVSPFAPWDKGESRAMSWIGSQCFRILILAFLYKMGSVIFRMQMDSLKHRDTAYWKALFYSLVVGAVLGYLAYMPDTGSCVEQDHLGCSEYESRDDTRSEADRLNEGIERCALTSVVLCVGVWRARARNEEAERALAREADEI